MKEWGNPNLPKLQLVLRGMTRCLATPHFQPASHFHVACIFFLIQHSFFGLGHEKWSENKTWNVWRIVIGVNSSCRSFHELALAGHLLLHPPDTAHGPDVLHAGDAALPAVEGEEARGGGSAAIPARTRRSHRMGVCPHWRRMWRTGEFTAAKVKSWFILRWWDGFAVYLQGSSFHLSDLKDPGVYKPLIIGVMLMVFQQMTGINDVMFYAENIFEQAHFEVKSFSLIFVCVQSSSVFRKTQSGLSATCKNYLIWYFIGAAVVYTKKKTNMLFGMQPQFEFQSKTAFK